MKVTREMVQAYADAYDRGEQLRERLAAVFRLIDPVPEDVDIIIDGDGDEWRRNPDDPMVWRLPDGSMLRTYRNIEERYGPITWEGKK